MKISFDIPSSFISNFRVETLILQDEISAYSNNMKLSNLIKLNNIHLRY